jgi:hypothetical protein
MKYIVLQVVVNGLIREVPIIFPSFLIHSNIAKSIKHNLAMNHNWMQSEVVSAGELNFLGAEPNCSGASETLGISSRGAVDDQLITMYDYNHGIV